MTGSVTGVSEGVAWEEGQGMLLSGSSEVRGVTTSGVVCEEGVGVGGGRPELHEINSQSGMRVVLEIAGEFSFSKAGKMSSR